MNQRLQNILSGLSASSLEFQSEHSLRGDLGLDSMALMQLAVKIHKEFGVDLGDLADRGQKFDFVADLEKCLK